MMGNPQGDHEASHPYKDDNRLLDQLVIIVRAGVERSGVGTLAVALRPPCPDGVGTLAVALS
jgi:hypothetical protein